MTTTAAPEELVRHLAHVTGLDDAAARRVVGEVIAFFSETAEEFVRRRHRELQRAGRNNAEIFSIVSAELAARPVAAPALSERQLRRLVYG